MRFVLLGLAASLVLFCRATIAGEPPAIGRKIERFQLRDCEGAAFDLGDLSEQKLVVVAFLGTECPLARLYTPRLVELLRDYKGKGVAVVGINSNQQDSPAELGAFARAFKIDFPLLKDPANEIADAFGAERTPEVFVLDHERVIRYRGRIDDQYGVGFRRARPGRHDLVAAIDELLEGKPVSVASTEPVGCHIGRKSRRPPRGELTYTRDVAPILQKHCVTCHRPGEVAPFTLTSHDDAVDWSATIREVVEAKRMPPWHADAKPGLFQNDRRLSDLERETLFDWIDNGMPEGDPADLPPAPKLAQGWEIPEPDVVTSMQHPFTVPARGTVEYQYFPLEYEFDEDRWIAAAEARPGNRAVVHHLILFFVPPGRQQNPGEAALLNSLAIFAPGMPAWRAPRGMARRIPAGSKLYLQAHYTPNGAEAIDLSRAGLVFADPKTIEKRLITGAIINTDFRIAPGDANARVEAEIGIGRDVQLISLFPHMHLRGKAFHVEAIDSDGRRQSLLDVPQYDFNWQNTYVFSQPVALREGSKLACVATYDNSKGNPVNPDPAATVSWGDQTWQEMMVAVYEYVLGEQDLRLGLPRIGKASGDGFEVEFRYRPREAAEAVYLAGSFNEWKPTAHKMDGPDGSGNFTTRLVLKPGDYEYKFVVNGTLWRNDPGNPELAGRHQNSRLQVKPARPEGSAN